VTRSLAVLAALLAVLAVALVAAGCGSTGSSSTTSTTSNASTGRLGAAVTECPGFSTDRDEVAILRGLGVSCEVAHKIALAQLTRGERLPEDWSCTRHLMDGNTKNDESVACHNRYEDEAVQFTVRWL
jgi:hypothetical protein